MPYDPPRPGNPAVLFVTGDESRAFSYEPGANPWYVSMHSKGWRPLDLLLFADDEPHARKILRELCTFWGKCLDEYAQWQADVTGDIPEHPEVELARSYSRRKLNMLSGLLEGDDVKKVWTWGSGNERSEEMFLDLVPFDRTTLLKVAWADRGID